MKRYTRNELQRMYEKPSQELTDRIHQTIISLPAQKQEEEIVKKKVSFSIVFVFVILFALAAVAYAASTGWIREVTWQGEPVEATNEPYMGPGITDEYTEKSQLIEEVAQSIPDGDYAEISYRGESFSMWKTRKKQKVFSSFEEFRQFMAGVDYLTAPVWLPENTVSFTATVTMDSKPKEDADENDYIISVDESGNETVELPGCYELIEEKDVKEVHVDHYVLDDADAVVTGYKIILGIEGHRDIEIDSELSVAIGESSFWLAEGETASPLEVEGVTKALLVSSEDPDMYDKLFLDKELDHSVTFVPAMDGMKTSSRESAYVLFYDQAPETIIRIMTGK